MVNPRNRSVGILFAILVVVMLGFGIIIPVLPLYARSMGATSVHLGFLMATFSVFQFIFAPIWGSLSDRIGRKPVLMIGLVGYMLSHLFNGAAQNVWMLFLARMLGGMLSSATLPISLALISDVTDEKDRGGGMGIMGAAMGTGIVFGPSLGGLVSHYTDSYRMPFFVAAALVAVLIPLAWSLLRETLPASERERHQLAYTANGSPSPVDRFRGLTRALHGHLRFYFLLTFLVSFAAANLEGIFSFFVMDKFGYGSREIGVMFTVLGITLVVLQGFLVGRAINRIGEPRLILFGMLVTAAGFYLLTLAHSFLTVTIFLTINMSGGAFLRPSINSTVSKRTLAGQGATMGLIGSFDSLGRMVGPVWAGLVYKLGVNFPFYTGAAITCIAMVTSAFVLRRPALAPSLDPMARK